MGNKIILIFFVSPIQWHQPHIPHSTTKPKIMADKGQNVIAHDGGAQLEVSFSIGKIVDMDVKLCVGEGAALVGGELGVDELIGALVDVVNIELEGE
jgi:hypothetical protein